MPVESNEPLAGLLDDPEKLSARLRELEREEATHRSAAEKCKREIEELATLALQRRAQALLKQEGDLADRERALARRVEEVSRQERALATERSALAQLRDLFSGAPA